MAVGTEGRVSVLSVFSTSLPWAPSLLSREPGTWKRGGTGQASRGYGSDSDHDLYLCPPLSGCFLCLFPWPLSPLVPGFVQTWLFRREAAC